MRVTRSYTLPFFGLALAAGLAAQAPQYAIFGAGCPGSLGVTSLSLISAPVAGGTLQVGLANMPLNAAIMLTGFSNTTSPFGPLPVSLGAFGMAGCVGHVSPDSTQFQFGPTYSLGLPPGVGIVGFRFYQQALVLDPVAGNSLGAVMSDAADVVVGPLSIRADMVPVPAGSFAMGSNAYVGPPTNYVWEAPVHQVNITRPFWIGKYEVTQAEYQAVMNANPSGFQGASLPVERVTWADAVAFCQALTVHEALVGGLPTGYQYRLPTEAEWEYCCRAGTTTEFHTGAALGCGQANYYDEVAQAYCVGQTSVVGSYAPNAWGIHDLHGNVWEWCLDSWNGSANYPAGPVNDPYVANVHPTDKICRGGSWGNDSVPCRSAFRLQWFSGNAYDNFGFRVVLAPIIP